MAIAVPTPRPLPTPLLRLRSDEQLLTLFRGGREDAFRALHDRYHERLLSYVRHMLRGSSEAEDVVQDVFAQAWKQASRFDAARANAGAWLMMMSRSRAIDRLRARRTRLQTIPDAETLADAPEGTPDPESRAMTTEDATRVRAALAALDDAQRAPIELAYYEGLSQTEIAERLHEPLGTVKTRIRTGLLKLRSALGGG